MRINSIHFGVVLGVLTTVLVVGCGDKPDEQVQSAGSQPNITENKSVPAETREKVNAAVTAETQKMDAYSKAMSEQYKNNPPVVK